MNVCTIDFNVFKTEFLDVATDKLQTVLNELFY